MVKEIPDFAEKVVLHYYNISKDEKDQQYNEIQPPAILINDSLFSEGHVPIIKKLSRELLALIK